MRLEGKLEGFIDKLATAPQLNNVFNQYSKDIRENALRRYNLALYLKSMCELKPKVLFAGEAPGYHGCRLTGIPFTSEYIIINDNYIFGENRGFRKTTERQGIQRKTGHRPWQKLTLNKNF